MCPPYLDGPGIKVVGEGYPALCPKKLSKRPLGLTTVSPPELKGPRTRPFFQFGLPALPYPAWTRGFQPEVLNEPLKMPC